MLVTKHSAQSKKHQMKIDFEILEICFSFQSMSLKKTCILACKTMSCLNSRSSCRKFQEKLTPTRFARCK